MRLVDQEQEIVVEGSVDSIIYFSEENGFTVFTLLIDNRSGQLSLEDDPLAARLTCTAYLSAIHEGEILKVAGRMVNNPRYGRQLSAAHVEKTVPTSPKGIERYLASGVIKGVGARTARRIVKAYGEKTFDIIEHQPELLAELPGISLKKAMQISEAFHAQAALRQAMIFLQEFGISPTLAMKIYKQYKEKTIDLVKVNPFQLADDITGIGFKTADAIAARVGIADDADMRVSAGLRYCLWEAAGNGHTCLPERVLLEQAHSLLRVDRSLINNRLVGMQLERQIHRETAGIPGEALVFLNSFYQAEVNVARRLAELDYHAETARAGDIARQRHEAEQSIRAIARDTGVTLSDGQREAVLSALTYGVLVITGGPGTGKTTTINTIIGLLSAKGLKIALAAPTGRAAKRMTDATGREAKTLHRLLETAFIAGDTGRQTFQRNEENPLEADAVIVDEISMTDILLMNSLLRAIPPGTRLILVGDVDQLPSVGPGNVLKDIIASGCLKVVRLTEIFRQAQESAIIMNAHRINHGEYPLLNENNTDFFFIRREQADEVAASLLSLITQRLPGYKPLDILQDIQVLTPMRKSLLGVESLNSLLQKHLNPPSPQKKERELRSILFREGDKVMQTKNNYALSWIMYGARHERLDEGEGVYNGDSGVIKEIDDENETLTVLFDDNRTVLYDFSQLDELDLAYAVTIHKSQGSEYRVVVIPLLGGPPMLLSRNLLYTAVTRARELVVVVGLPETIHRMVDNNHPVNRYTALERRLHTMFHLRNGQDGA